MEKQKKRFPLFYCIYFVCVIVVVVLIHLSMNVVTDYLAEYELAQPQYEAEAVFDAYYGNGDFTKLVALCEVPLTQFETRDAIVKYLADFTAGKKITYSAITTGLDTSLRYIVKADDIKFSAFTLKESSKTTEKGFTLYEADNFELYCAGNETVRITAPKGYTVTVNNIALDDTYLTGAETRDKSWDYMPEGVEGITFVEYAVEDLYAQSHTVAVQAPDGRDCQLQTLEDGSFSANFLYSDTLAATYSDYVLDAAKTVSAYMQNDGRLSNVAAVVDPDSQLYDNIRNTETWFVISHNSYGFEDASVTEFYQYDENTFSCRIAFTHVLKRTWSEDYRDYIDITYFFRRVGDKFMMYERYNHL